MLISVYRGTNFYIIHKNIQLTCLLQTEKAHSVCGVFQHHTTIIAAESAVILL